MHKQGGSGTKDVCIWDIEVTFDLPLHLPPKSLQNLNFYTITLHPQDLGEIHL
jgi:hypothetical protein